MSQTNFDKVIEFNKSFEIEVNDEPQPNIFTDNPELTKLRLDLIKEEVDELIVAIKEKDFTETIDALSDILYVVYGAGASFGIELNQTMDIVHKSNMTKLCKTEEEAKKTVAWYKKNSKIYNTPTYKKSKNGDYWIIYNEETGKILKSINYTEANFDTIYKKK